MGTNFRPLPVKCVEAYLKQNGFAFDRITASHHIWTKNGHRSIPLWGSKKEIPAIHLKTSCRSIGTTMDDLYNWAEKNC